MARRNDKTLFQEPSHAPKLLVPQLKATEEIARQIEVGENLLRRDLSAPADLKKFDADYNSWVDFVHELLRRIFDTNEYADNFRDNFGVSIAYMGETSFRDEVQQSKSYVENSLQRLRSLLQRIPLIDEFVSDARSVPQSANHELNHKVFVVHGHDGQAKSEVARVLEKIGLEPIILHEQANQGQTIIEKIEANADVGFAVVLLTPDDPNGLIPSGPSKRARQNVILELGYFIGKLGRARVCPLYKDGVELPSDLGGVVYVLMDIYGAWQMQLVKELKAAKYKVSSDDL